LKDSVPPVLLYLDGDHAYDPTLEYFSDLLKYSEQDTIFVLDDIRWSSGMERAWKVIKANPESVVSLDLFFMGIVFFKKGLMKQSVKINF
jgi:predicted O-methyltransferase YrrM